MWAVAYDVLLVFVYLCDQSKEGVSCAHSCKFESLLQSSTSGRLWHDYVVLDPAARENVAA
jgi:hypothetical protein